MTPDRIQSIGFGLITVLAMAALIGVDWLFHKIDQKRRQEMWEQYDRQSATQEGNE